MEKVEAYRSKNGNVYSYEHDAKTADIEWERKTATDKVVNLLVNLDVVSHRRDSGTVRTIIENFDAVKKIWEEVHGTKT